MKLRLLSDLHLEGYSNYYHLFDQPADVLILAGDIHVGFNNVEDVLAYASTKYDHVIYLPGNHEYYKHDMKELDNLNVPCNVHFLNPGSVVINKVKFIGATLWTNFNHDPVSIDMAQRCINDFRVIKGLTTTQAVRRYDKELGFIKRELDVYHQGPRIVVTHFLPAQACIHPRYLSDTSGINDYFANHNDEYIAGLQNVPYWFFGHTHDHIDTKLGSTRLISNPLGYSHEQNKLNEDTYEVL